MKRYLLVSVFVVACFNLHAQETIIDGKLDEKHWESAMEFTQFKSYKPDIGIDASENTKVFVCNDSANLYVAVLAYDKEPSKIMANLTSRDNLSNDDAFTLEIDENGSSNSNVFFRVNPLGIQCDGVITQDEDEDLNPDRVWFSKGFVTDFGYQVEMAIPFKTLRFKWNPTVELKMGFMRKIYHKSELVVYPEYKTTFSNRLMQRETLLFSNIKQQRVLEIIPFVTYTFDNELNNSEWRVSQNKVDAGVTAKIGINSDLVVGLTYNPDFSQIESDAGAIDVNLRNALFFPEKRPFFQEGIELFNYGGGGIYNMPLENIVHTRNIVDPIYGVKLTGNLGKKYSIASIISTDESTGINDHYQILRLQRKFSDDGFIGVTYTGKETTHGYNRVGGFDGKVRLNGKNSIEYSIFRSFTADTLTIKEGNNFGLNYNYKDRYNSILVGYYQNDELFHTETGFLNRKGLHVFPAQYNVNIPLKYGWVNKWAVWVSTRPKIDMLSNKFEQWTYAGIELYFKNDSWLWLGKSFATEIFQNERFKAGNYAGGYTLQMNKYINLDGYLSWGNRIYYNELDPFQGQGWSSLQSVILTPTKQLKFKLTGRYANFYKTSPNKFIYDYSLLRLHSTYQINKNLFVRAVGEYNFYHEKLNSEVLVSFTYIPGTVIQLGYNIYAAKNIVDDNQIYGDELTVNRNLMFFKASYLFGNTHM